jgi:predicted DNA-binding transcriptional regulator YafY
MGTWIPQRTLYWFSKSCLTCGSDMVIHQKFMAALSKDKFHEIRSLLETVKYRSQSNVSHSSFLTDLMKAARDRTPVWMDYRQRENIHDLFYIHDLFLQQGLWFFHCYCLSSHHWHVFRCDCVQSVQPSDPSPVLPFKTRRDAEEDMQAYFYRDQTFHFQCLLTPAGKEHFLRNNFYDMKVEQNSSGQWLLSGSAAQQDLDYLVEYLIAFGRNLQILSPSLLKQRYIQALQEMLETNEKDLHHNDADQKTDS